MHRRRSNGRLNALLVRSVSARALIMRSPISGSLRPDGTSPQRTTSSTRSPWLLGHHRHVGPGGDVVAGLELLAAAPRSRGSARRGSSARRPRRSGRTCGPTVPGPESVDPGRPVASESDRPVGFLRARSRRGAARTPTWRGRDQGRAHPPAHRRARRAGVQPPGLRRRLAARPHRRHRPRKGRDLQPLRLQGAARARGLRLRDVPGHRRPGPLPGRRHRRHRPAARG